MGYFQRLAFEASEFFLEQIFAGSHPSQVGIFFMNQSFVPEFWIYSPQPIKTGVVGVFKKHLSSFLLLGDSVCVNPIISTFHNETGSRKFLL